MNKHPKVFTTRDTESVQKIIHTNTGINLRDLVKQTMLKTK